MFEWLSSFRPARAAVTQARASNEQYEPTARPVGLFLGGTGGIGQAMAEQLAKQTKGRAQIVLLGRNQAAADEIIASFPRTPEGTSSAEESKYSFVKVDVTSMEGVRNVTARLSKELDKVNFIVVSPGVLSMKGRDETSEGIDRKMACNFYARFRFIYDLAPLVAKAADKGEQTGVMSVFAAGNGFPIDLDDLGLVKGFTLKKAHDHIITYKDAVFQEFASRYPKVSFNHIFPGIVITQAVTKWTAARILIPLFRPITVSAEQCAQVMWWRMWNPEPQWRSGAHQLDHHGEELKRNQFVTPEVKKAVWDHAIEMTSDRRGTSTQPKSVRIIPSPMIPVGDTLPQPHIYRH